MNWDKAKNIVILLLILLNVSLLGLNRYYSNERYALSRERENAIYEVLADNGIGIYTNLVDSFWPMRRLSVQITTLETDTLRKMFFEDGDEVKVTIEFNKTILRSGTKTLTIENNLIVYEDAAQAPEMQEIDRDTALSQSNAFLNGLGEEYAAFQLDNTKKTGEGYLFEYFSQYKGNKVFSIYSKISVDGAGVRRAEISYFKTESFTGQREEICSTDEAVLTFLKEIRREGRKGSVFIDSMELGYGLQEETEVAEGKHIRLVPCYRIHIIGREAPYMINAYTNEIIK